MRERADYSKFDAETGVQTHDSNGNEIPDPTPMQPPIGFTRQDPLSVRIREMIVGHKLAEEARTAGAETFEEADDFAVGDDWEAEQHSPYEANFDNMTPEELAALSTSGRAVDRIVTDEETENLARRVRPSKQKKQGSGDQPDSGIGSVSDDPADP